MADRHRQRSLSAGRGVETVWGLIATHAAGQGRRMPWPACALLRLVRAGDGACVTAASGQGPDFVMCVGGPVSEQLAELQPGRQWPTFTAEASKLGARAVFAFRWPSAYVTKPTGFDLFIDAIRKAGNFYLALARLPP